MSETVTEWRAVAQTGSHPDDQRKRTPWNDEGTARAFEESMRNGGWPEVWLERRTVTYGEAERVL